MFLLTLPKAAPPEGGCRINGRPAVYRLHPGRIEFRHHDTDGWESRTILDRQPQGDLILYICDDGLEGDGPYHVVGLNATNQHTPAVTLTSWLPADQTMQAADRQGVQGADPQA